MRFFPHLQKFGAACKEWRGIAYEIIKTLPAKIKSEPPMLMLPYNQETQTATFLEMGNSKMYDVKMPELKDQCICWASKGWLAIMDINFDLSLFDTVTRARIKLPPPHGSEIEWFHEHYGVANINDRFRLFWKVTLSGDPTSSDCLVAVIYSSRHRPGVCRLGDEDWTMVVSESQRCYEDMYFYQGKIFAVKLRWTIHVYEYHKQGDLRLMKQIGLPRCDPEWPFTVKLFESCGDLFLVRSGGIDEGIWGFEVHRFEPTSKEKVPWSRVYDLGDRSLFQGINDFICLPVKEFPWCKPNRIYFTASLSSVWGIIGRMAYIACRRIGSLQDLIFDTQFQLSLGHYAYGINRIVK